jgi:hypothetical protein
MAALVLVAASARALAECLRRTGLPDRGTPLLAVDAFGDEDLLAAVDGWRQLPLPDLRRPQRVVATVEALLASHAALSGPRTPPAVAAGCRVDVLLGGGFDGSAAVLRRLADRYRVLNTSPHSWAAARDPLLFMRLGIRTPETRVSPPTSPFGWLRKDANGSAGLAVSAAAVPPLQPPVAAARPRGSLYWQRRSVGVPVSLLFCAHAGGVLPVGVNRQWCSPAPGLPFRFGGVASGFEPGPAYGDAVCTQLLAAADRLTAATGLRGLASLDAMLDRDGQVDALELNPRPTASVELYDRDAPGLLRLHIAAVLGQALPQWFAPSGSRALAVVYARHLVVAGPRPESACDWRCGAMVAGGAPLCTVHAAGDDALATMRRVRAAARRLSAAGSPGSGIGDHAPDGRGFSYNAGEPSSGHRSSSLGRDHA